MYVSMCLQRYLLGHAIHYTTCDYLIIRFSSSKVFDILFLLPTAILFQSMSVKRLPVRLEVIPVDVNHLYYMSQVNIVHSTSNIINIIQLL